MVVEYLKEVGPSLAEQGYHVLPLAPGEKYPLIKNWSKIEASAQEVRKWANNGYRASGVGILCGNVIGVDIDILDKEISKKVIDWCIRNLGQAPQRVGLAPKTLFVFRTEVPFTKISSNTYSDFFEDVHKIEILGKGQQFVAYAKHPDTGRSYKWVNGPGISDIPFEELPLITRKQVLKLVEYFESITPPEWELKSGGQTGGQVANSQGSFDYNSIEHYKPKANKTTKQIEALLEEIRFVADEPGQYRNWVNVGMGLWHQYDGSDEGFELWDNWSSGGYEYEHCKKEMRSKWHGFKPKDPNYVVFATTIKLRNDYVERTRRTEQIEKIKEARYCNSSYFSNANNKLDDLEGDIDVLDLFLNRYIHAEEGRMVCDLTKKPHRSLSKLEDFREATMQIKKEIAAPTKTEPDKTKFVSVCDLWRAHPDKRVVQASGYLPGGDRIFVDEEDDLSYINTFYMPDFSKYTDFFGDISVYLEHMGYLLPVEEEREWFIDWMAFCLQRPEERCKVTPLHVSVPHGTGRGWVVELLDILHGSWNCRKTKFKTLCGEGSGGGFNDYFNRSLLCCIEEVKESSKRYDVDDTIRDFLTEKKLNVNIKHGSNETDLVYTNFFFMSNHPDALVFKQSDRRIQVLSGPEDVRPQQYYSKLYDWLKNMDNIAALNRYLRERDISNFNWQVSTDTEGRKAMIVSNETPTETAFWEFVKDSGKIAITKAQLCEALQEYMEGDVFENPVEENQLVQILKKNFRQIGRIKYRGKMVRPWWLGGWSLKEIKSFDNKEIRALVDKNEKEDTEGDV